MAPASLCPSVWLPRGPSSAEKKILLPERVRNAGAGMTLGVKTAVTQV